jgi:XTP/dITP diphosphohydrolase
MPSSTPLLIATRNRHKTHQFAVALAGEYEVHDLSILGDRLGEVEESGKTFAENAKIKALAGAEHFEGIVLADDSGLCVDCLRGAPGVYSARFAGPDASDTDNNTKLLVELEEVGKRRERPAAHYICCIAIARGQEVLEVVEGRVDGVILPEPHGTGGFGYDPLFLPDGYDRTFAQMTDEEKLGFNHRGRAIRQAIEFLEKLLSST